MKKSSVLISIIFVLTFVGIALAADSATIDVSAEVTVSTELTWGMAQADSQLTPDPADDTFIGNQTAMSFLTLRHTLADGTEAATWFSRYYYAVFMSAITGGARYQMQSSSTGLYNADGVKLPKAWGMTAAACWDTVANAAIDCPSGASTGQAAPAEGTVIIYESGDVDTRTIAIRADYAIPSYAADGGVPFTGFEPIPVNQPAGTYSGNVVITVVPY